MSAERNIVLDALTAAARENGYKPVGNVYFYKEHPEVTCVLNLQRSAWGPQHYINAGVSLVRLAASRRPKLSGFHILWRADSLAEETGDSPFGVALDLESQMPDDARNQTIKEDVQRHAFVHLCQCTTEASALEVAHRIGAAVKQVVFVQKEAGNAVSH